MAGGRDDHVVARRVVIRHVVAADPGVGDDGGEILARVAASVLGDAAEIGAEISYHRLHHPGKLLRRELLPDPRRVGILRAEQLLRQLEHSRLVLFGHAENFHDDMQGIAEGDVFDEIASPALVEHALHGRARDLAHARLEFPEIGRHEPALRQRAVFRMIGRIHLHQRAHQIRPAGDLADALFHRPVRQRGRAVGIVEQLVLAADGLDMRMLCHDPERIELLGPRDAERVVGAEPAVAVMDAMVGIGGRIDERGRNVGGNVDIRRLRSLSYPWVFPVCLCHRATCAPMITR